MIYDRPYMRSDFGRRSTSALGWIIGITIGVFILQMVSIRWTSYGGLFPNYFALSTAAIQKGFVWTLLTYGFLHGGLWHIAGNLLAIFFIGRELVPILGSARFLGLYLGSIVVGGLSWLAIASLHPMGGAVIGASAAAFALLTVYACFFPDRPITLLLFFILPVTIRPKYLALGALAFSIFGVLFMEIPGVGSPIAHSAHLGGMLAGWIYFRFVHHRSTSFGSSKPRVEIPRWFRKKKKAVQPAQYQVNISKQEDIRAEVDRILDKINANGFGALTEEERKILDNAKDILNRR